MATLNDIKTLLRIKENNQDDLLNLIIANTTASLRLKLSLAAPKPIPDELSYIVTEVAVRRFNRLHNEGMKSYGQEGESITFDNNDFDAFADDIVQWKDTNAQVKTLGHVTFLNGHGRSVNGI
jgi:hypothetical protein